MARSPGFGSMTPNCCALFGLAFASAPPLRLSLAGRHNSQAHSSIGTTSGFDALCLVAGIRFQDLFHPPLGVLFTFPSRYWFAIGHRGVFSLAGWSPRLQAGFHVPRLTLGRAGPAGREGTGLSPCAARLPSRFPSPWQCRIARPEPRPKPVWALPLSLAATDGIDSLSFPPGT
jgi:hypothetical protein